MSNFDPRTVDVARVFDGDPDLPASTLQTDGFVQRFLLDRKWQPETFDREFKPKKPPAPAAVLLAVVPSEGLPNSNSKGSNGKDLNVLLTTRPSTMRNHAGQIALPGGKVDDDDESIETAALREGQEEVSLPPHAVQILGRLPVYPTGTGFAMHPVVGLIPDASIVQDLHPNPGEVDDVFLVPLAQLMRPAGHQLMQLEWQGELKQWFAMAVSDTDGVERYVWGATAGILRNLYKFLVA